VPPSPRPVRSSQWSLTTTSIVKELGQGFYSKVYLAQDVKHGFVALKTVDSQRIGVADECILNEISLLASLPPHLNIIRLVGCNREEKLVVVEYCFHGNLKDYVSRYREYFIDELCPDTKEMQEDAFLYSSPTAETSEQPVSDFLTSIHAGVDYPKDEDAVTFRHLPVVKQSKSLIKTRRLLYWSYQVSRGLRHLAEQGILHRDIALRNILLTNNDVVKIADFGLAVTMIAPSTPPRELITLTRCPNTGAGATSRPLTSGWRLSRCRPTSTRRCPMSGASGSLYGSFLRWARNPTETHPHRLMSFRCWDKDGG